MIEEIEVICPLYNASNYINDLIIDLKRQKNVELHLKFLLTESTDDTLDKLISADVYFEVIKAEEFSHSLSRENALMNSKCKYALLITQDIKFKDDFTIYNLLKYQKENNLTNCYARQVGVGRTLDKYFRMISYPSISHYYTKDDLVNVGQDACFMSDACCLYDTAVFKNINGYDNKNLPTNEDMYYAYKLLSNGYKVGYAHDAVIYHTHRYNLKQTYNRYILIGKFLKLNKQISDLSTKGRTKYIKVVFAMLKEFNIHSLLYLPFNVMARTLGMKKGRSL